MPLTRRDVVGHIKGLFYIYCIASCSTVLVFLMSLFGLPFLLLNKHFQRQLQQLAQSAWVYLLLGITAHAADSELIVYLPEECGPEMEKIVYEKLKMGFNFGLAAARLEESESPPTSRDRRRDIIISNHQIYMDWIYIWALMARIRREGNVKIILKRSLLNIPVFGIGMKMLNFIFLHRNWEIDRLQFGRRLLRLVYGNLPFSLVIFPEGTTNNKDSIPKSNKFALANNFPVPKHTIVPRVTGMQFAMNTLGSHIGGIFDLTIGYTGCRTDEFPEDTFGLKSLYVYGQAPPLIHIHVKYHAVSAIPYKETGDFSRWLYGQFQEKDALMDTFYKEGKFPGPPSKAIRMSRPFDMLFIALAAFTCTLIGLLVALAIYLFITVK